jgi:hypothetical protein
MGFMQGPFCFQKMLERITSIKSIANVNSGEWRKDFMWLRDEVERRIEVSDELEQLIIIGIINRSGTGSLVTAMGRAPTSEPVVRHIQPTKAIARRLMMEQRGVQPSTPLEFLEQEVKIGPGVQAVKETVGHNLMNPAEWVPDINLFLNRGVPPEKCVFVPTFREPFDMASSWKRMWGWEWEDFPYESFNVSHSITLDWMGRAKEKGIKVVPYVHEFIKKEQREQFVVAMFDKIGLPFSKDVIDWKDNGDPYWEGQIVKYDIPPAPWIEGVLSRKRGGRGGLVWKPVSPEHCLTPNERVFVGERIGPAIEIYTEVSRKAWEFYKL